MPSRLSRDEHPAGLGALQRCNCSSQAGPSGPWVFPHTPLGVLRLMKSPVSDKKPTLY